MSIAHKTVQKIGNSAGIVLSAELLRAAGLHSGDAIIIQAERGRLTITPLDPAFDAMVLAADRFVAHHPNALKKLGE